MLVFFRNDWPNALTIALVVSGVSVVLLIVTICVVCKRLNSRYEPANGINCKCQFMALKDSKLLRSSFSGRFKLTLFTFLVQTWVKYAFPLMKWSPCMCTSKDAILQQGLQQCRGIFVVNWIPEFRNYFLSLILFFRKPHTEKRLLRDVKIDSLNVPQDLLEQSRDEPPEKYPGVYVNPPGSVPYVDPTPDVKVK